MQRTVEVCPYSVCTHWPVSTFHTFSVRSVEPLTIRLPAIWDDQTPPVWPTSVRRHCDRGQADRVDRTTTARHWVTATLFTKILITFHITSPRTDVVESAVSDWSVPFRWWRTTLWACCHRTRWRCGCHRTRGTWWHGRHAPARPGRDGERHSYTVVLTSHCDTL